MSSVAGAGSRKKKFPEPELPQNRPAPKPCQPVHGAILPKFRLKESGISRYAYGIWWSRIVL